MAKKKTVKKTRKKKKAKQKVKTAKPKKQEKAELENAAIEIGSVQTDVKTFIKKFKEDISKKRKAYSAFAQKFSRKKQ